MKTILNFLYLLVSKGAGLILFTLVTPLLIQRIGIEGLGQVSVVMAFAFIIDSFTEYAFNITIVRDIASSEKTNQTVSQIFNNTLFAKIFLLTIGLIIAAFIVYIVPKYNALYLLFLQSFIFVFARALMPIWYFMGIEKMQGITIASLAAKFLYFLSVFFFVTSTEQEYLVILFWGLSELIVSVLALLFVVFGDEITISKPNYGEIMQLLKRDFIFSLSLFFFRIYTYIPVLVIGQVCNEFYAGVYSIADKIIAIIKDTIALLFNSLLPRAAHIYSVNREHAKKYVMKTTLGFTLLYLLGLMGINYLSKPIILYFTNQNTEIITMLIFVMSFSCIFVLLRLPHSIYVVLKRLDSLFAITLGMAAFILLILSYILIKKYQVMGAAYSVLVVEGLILVLLSIFTRENKLKSQRC